MSRCAHCERPIEPGTPTHRTPAGDFHGPCLDAETRDTEAREALRRRAAVDWRDAMTRAGERR